MKSDIVRIGKRGRMDITLTGCGLSGEEMLKRLLIQNLKVDTSARNLLLSPVYDEFHRLLPGQKYTVSLLPVDSVEAYQGTIYARTVENLKAVFSRRYEVSLAYSNVYTRCEIACLLHEVLTADLLTEMGLRYIVVMSNFFIAPLKTSEGIINLMKISRNPKYPNKGSILETVQISKDVNRNSFGWEKLGAIARVTSIQ